MLVLTGSDGNNLESPVAKRFWHSNYFIFFNTNAKTFAKKMLGISND